MDTKGFGAPTKMLMSLMFHTSINKQKNSEGLNRVTMKLLTDFCVSQPIPSLDMTTEGNFMSDTHIYSSQEFLFTCCLRSPFNLIRSGGTLGTPFRFFVITLSPVQAGLFW